MWRANDTLGLAKQGDFKGAAANMPKLTAMFLSYVVAPAAIEEMVSGSGDPREGLMQKAFWGSVHAGTGSWAYLRDFGAAAAYGRDPSGGLFSTAFKTGTDFLRDWEKKQGPFTKKNAGLFIQHGLTFFGALTGLTNAEEGKLARGMYDYMTGQTHPQGFKQWWRIIRTGSPKEPRR